MDGASQQLALALFADHTLRGEGVEKAPTELGFRRSNAFVKIVDLSLAARRLIDVAYFIASEDSSLHKEYRVDLGLFRWLLSTTSRNHRHLNQLIREAQQAAIVLNEIDTEDSSKDRYGSVPLMGPAFVGNGEFTFELSDRLQHVIKNPTASHFLSLRYVFKSIHTKVLYDRLQPYRADGITPWQEVVELRLSLECVKKTYGVWKHFRNKVLEVAIAEIRDVTGLTVEIVTQNLPGTKRVGHVRFRITETGEPKNEQKLEFIVLRGLYETLRKEFALSQAEFNEIITNREIYTDERIQQAIDYTRHNASKGKVRLRAGGYFMKALRENYLLGELDRKIHMKTTDAGAAQLAAEQAEADIQAKIHAEALARDEALANLGWATFEQSTASSQAAFLQEFCNSPTAKILARTLSVECTAEELGDHLANPKIRNSFGTFVATKVKQAARPNRKTKTD